jgi:hypothetical protein
MPVVWDRELVSHSHYRGSSSIGTRTRMIAAAAAAAAAADEEAKGEKLQHK